MIDLAIDVLKMTAGTFAGCYLFFCLAGRHSDIGDGLAAMAKNVYGRMVALEKEPVIVLTTDGSKPGRMDAEDFTKIFKGAVMAAGGALVAWAVTYWLPIVDQSTMQGAITAAVASVILNFLHKWFADNSQTRLVEEGKK